MMKRQQYSKSLKAKIALDALKGQRTMAELSSEYSVHSSQIAKWKKQLLDGAEDIFTRGNKGAEKQYEKERDRLYQKVGQLQVEVDFLKKVGGSHP